MVWILITIERPHPATHVDMEGPQVNTAGRETRTGICARGVAALCALAVLVDASPALALPTPDVLVGIVNLVPVLIAAAASALGGAWLLFRRSVRFRAIVILSAIAVIVVSFAAYSWHKNTTEKRIRMTGVYLRCDLLHHDRRELRNLPGNSDSWLKYGNFREIRWSQITGKIERQPSAALVACFHRSIDYDSGIPAPYVNGELRPFEFVYRS